MFKTTIISLTTAVVSSQFDVSGATDANCPVGYQGGTMVVADLKAWAGTTDDCVTMTTTFELVENTGETPVIAAVDCTKETTDNTCVLMTLNSEVPGNLFLMGEWMCAPVAQVMAEATMTPMPDVFSDATCATSITNVVKVAGLNVADGVVWWAANTASFYSAVALVLLI